jgi:anion transporter
MRPSLVANRRVPLMIVILVSLASFLVGLTFADVTDLSLFVIPHSTVVWGLLIFGVALSAPVAWRRGKTALAKRGVESSLATPGEVLQRALAALVESTNVKLLLGPAVGLLVWCLPLELNPAAHKAMAIVGLMVVYWITAVVDNGVTAVLGCVLFWLLHVAPPQVAFSGFTSQAPWFILGSLLIGLAVTQSGLAKRLGYAIISAAQGSLPHVLFIFAVMIYLLSFVLTSSGQVALLAPLVLGLVTALGLSSQGNLAKGTFLLIAYVSGLYDKTTLASPSTIIAWGLLEKVGIRVLWSQWFLAFVPLALLTLFTSWLVVRWLYPPETVVQSANHPLRQAEGPALGPWSLDEYKVLGWSMLTLGLWATDFVHHISPAAVSIVVGLLLTFPRIGVLDTKAIRLVHFWAIMFSAGALSMAAVLSETHALDSLATLLSTWQGVLSSAWSATLTIYWGSFLYHFLMSGETGMVSSLVPILLKVADSQGYNPLTMTMLSVDSMTGKLFVYQHTGLVLGYAYGVLQVRDVLKFAAIMTVVQGLFILLLVTLYWPIIGLHWHATPPAAVAPSPIAAASVLPPDASPWNKELLLPTAAVPVVTPLPSGIYVPGAAALHTTGP